MFQKLKQKSKEQKGFTLVELLAVIVILGIIAAIAVPSVLRIIDNSKKDAHVANAQQIINAAKTAASDNNLTPTTSAAIYLSLDYLQKKEYIDTVKDPDGASYVAGTYNETSITTGEGTTPATVLTDPPSANTSYVKISLSSGKIVYSVRLYGSKRHIDEVASNSLTRSLVVDN
jgi:type IV pilus assembly protein PilA